MKKTFFLFLLPIVCHSQYEYAIKLHNNAREIYTDYSIDKFQLYENNYGMISYITYSKELSVEAQKRADKLAKEFFKFYDGDNNKNFWFTEIAIGSDGSKVFFSNEEYVTNAVLNWSQLEFDYQKYLSGEKLCYESNDISDFLNVVWGNNTQVGFGIAKSETQVFVVASYGFKILK